MGWRCRSSPRAPAAASRSSSSSSARSVDCCQLAFWVCWNETSGWICESSTRGGGGNPQQFQLLGLFAVGRNLPDGSVRGRKQGEPQQFQLLGQIDVSMKSIKSCLLLPACLPAASFTHSHRGRLRCSTAVPDRCRASCICVRGGVRAALQRRCNNRYIQSMHLHANSSHSTPRVTCDTPCEGDACWHAVQGGGRCAKAPMRRCTAVILPISVTRPCGGLGCQPARCTPKGDCRPQCLMLCRKLCAACALRGGSHAALYDWAICFADLRTEPSPAYRRASATRRRARCGAAAMRRCTTGASRSRTWRAMCGLPTPTPHNSTCWPARRSTASPSSGTPTTRRRVLDCKHRTNQQARHILLRCNAVLLTVEPALFGFRQYEHTRLNGCNQWLSCLVRDSL